MQESSHHRAPAARRSKLGLKIGLVAALGLGCAAGDTLPPEGSAGGGAPSPVDAGAGAADTAGSGAFGSQGSGGGFTTPGDGGAPPAQGGDPKTCAEAAANRTYIGCDFWPTVTANVVWSVFDYAVVAANAGDAPATVSVERGGVTLSTTTIAPNSAGTIYLPWVPELKGLDSNMCGYPVPMTASVRADGGAYHLTSTVPITLYQFSALEYQPSGGPPGKDWSSCPASQCGLNCYAYSNDASLLLPSTAMTGNYRVTTTKGWPLANIGSYFAITGTADGTNVTVYVSGSGTILGGDGVTATPAGGTYTTTIDAGDVLQIVGSAATDLSGSLVKADQPVQVLAGMQCVYLPENIGACDHIEESVMPAETLGQHYFVPVPTSPHGTTYGHIVRLYGNVDDTHLTYPSGIVPPGAPSVIHAGQTIDLGIVSNGFEIVGDHEFAVNAFLLGANLVDANPDAFVRMGDPSQSQMIPVEQYRTKYVFLAPADYAENFVDIVMPTSASVSLDGAPMTTPTSALGSGYGVARVPLGAGASGGSHVIEASEPVGIQVVGYGLQTSYQYPGGLNLDVIAPPPPPPQ